jgi:hypothetical protein
MTDKEWVRFLKDSISFWKAEDKEYGLDSKRRSWLIKLEKQLLRVE